MISGTEVEVVDRFHGMAYILAKGLSFKVESYEALREHLEWAAAESLEGFGPAELGIISAHCGKEVTIYQENLFEFGPINGDDVLMGNVIEILLRKVWEIILQQNTKTFLSQRPTGPVIYAEGVQ